MRFFVLPEIVLTALLASPALAATMTGAASPIGERFCAVSDSDSGTALRCPGPAGIDAHIRREGTRFSISLGNVEEGFVGLGSVNILGATMEWRLIDGQPTSGVVRFRLPGEAGGDSLGDIFAILKVAGEDRPGCLIGLVDGTVNPQGRALARRVADEEGARFTCGEAKSRFYGFSSDWARQAVGELP